MRSVLQKRPLRLVLLANVVSMLGSGMNSAAVTWHILQETHSEIALGTLIVLQTVPAMLLMPFSGVFIDREDRRRIVMGLDAGRALITLAIAVLALRGEVRLWHLYAMNVIVSAGFWMFWPTITALIQELTPESHFVESNSALMAGVQGGWLMAGAVVGFIYNKVGLGGVLMIDFCTYIVSFACYLGVRKGRHRVYEAPQLGASQGVLQKFFHELREGFDYLRGSPGVVAIGATWAIFIGAMMSQTVVTAPLSDRILNAGATGYGWLNAGWGTGAFLSAAYVGWSMRRFGAREITLVGLGLLCLSMYVAPFSRWLAAAVALYFVMGSARGFSGISINSGLMHAVPKQYMGRVQNAFSLVATTIQIVVGLAIGFLAHYWSLTAAFFVIATLYAVACWTALRMPNDGHPS